MISSKSPEGLSRRQLLQPCNAVPHRLREVMSEGLAIQRPLVEGVVEARAGDPIRSARSRTDVRSKPCAQKQFIAASSTVVSSNSLGRAIGLLTPAARRCRNLMIGRQILEHPCQNGKAIVSIRLPFILKQVI